MTSTANDQLILNMYLYFLFIEQGESKHQYALVYFSKEAIYCKTNTSQILSEDMIPNEIVTVENLRS